MVSRAPCGRMQGVQLWLHPALLTWMPACRFGTRYALRLQYVGACRTIQHHDPAHGAPEGSALLEALQAVASMITDVSLPPPHRLRMYAVNIIHVNCTCSHASSGL